MSTVLGDDFCSPIQYVVYFLEVSWDNSMEITGPG